MILDEPLRAKSSSKSLRDFDWAGLHYRGVLFLRTVNPFYILSSITCVNRTYPLKSRCA